MYYSMPWAIYLTDTALLKVQNDVLSALDQESSVVALVMLDLSAAFDTIDHAFLLSRLSEMYGIHGQVFIWISCYRLHKIDYKKSILK